MILSNFYDWDKAVLQEQDVFESVAKFLRQGHFHPHVLSTEYLIFYTLQSYDNPFTLKREFSNIFFEMNSLVHIIRTVWIWLIFCWRHYHADSIPSVETKHHGRIPIYTAWLYFVRKNCFPPYRRSRCKRNPQFFHKSSLTCSFCNPQYTFPDIPHQLELLYLHAWAQIERFNWTYIFDTARKQPFTVCNIPHISLSHQFTVFKLLVEDEIESTTSDEGDQAP